MVIRLAEVQYWTGANPGYLVNRAVQVNSSARLSELGRFSIPFVPAYQKLVLHKIAILRGDQVLDRTKTASVRVLDTEKDAANGYYYGTSSAEVLLEDVKAGDTLWTTYSVHGTNPVYGSIWSELLPWDKESPMELRKAVVLHPSNKPVHWRFSGVPRPGLPQPQIEVRKGTTRLVFQESAVAAEQFEPSMPPNLIPVPVLDFSEYGDWSQVAKWAAALFPDMGTRPEVQALARTFDGRTPEERAAQALHWVQDEIRYFSVAMGENSHRPQPPEVVLRRRFGDCKDKSQLLVAVYHAMGLEAQPVLVQADSPKFPSQMQPSPKSFNHVIVRVLLNGKAYFVDPTRLNERGPIANLSVPLPSGDALIVANDSKGLISLPNDPMDVPLVERSEKITIPAMNADAQLALRVEYRGRMATGMRQLYRSLGSVELKKAMLEQFERTYPGVRLEGPPQFSDGADGSSFIVEGRLTIPKALKEDDGIVQLSQRSHIMEGTFGIPDKLVRKQPFWLAAGHFRARYVLDVSLPNEARLTKDDRSFSVKNQYFHAHEQLTWRGANLNYIVDFSITEPEVAASELPGLVNEIDKLSRLFESKLRFKPVSVPPREAKEASLRVLDILEKLSRHQDLQQEALRTGKIPELNFDEGVYAKLNYRALCESVVDSYAIRQWNPVILAPIAALGKLVDARADKRTKDLCDARFTIIRHDLPQASKELAALVPSDDDPLTLMQAWANFHAHEVEQARNNLSRFLKAKAKAGSLAADDALLSLALVRRLGLEEPLEIQDFVDALYPGVWPQPLFGLLRGTVPEEELSAALARLAPAAREHAEAEVHFVLSQHCLATSQPRKADFHLNWFERYALLGSAFEVLADADKYGKTREDPDMREFWRLEREKGSASSIMSHLQAAANNGVARAQSVLGSRYMEGRGVRQDLAKAESLLQAAAAKGDSNAMHDLGVIYGDETNGKRDQKRAVAHFMQSAENGNGYAGYVLGRSYWLARHGLPYDFDLAFRYTKDGAEMEHEGAQFFLSLMYYQGKGTEKNDNLALFWATQSFLRKHDDGSALFGLLLLQLETDEKIRSFGLQLLTRMAARGNSFAQLELGNLMLNGIGVPADQTNAFKLIQSAHLKGHDRATALLGRMLVEGLGVTADPRKGFELLAEVEKRNIPDAFYQLGRVYRRDNSGMTDKKKAAEYFRRGAELGQREAAQSLALMLHTGEGIPRDIPKAVQYYEQAVASGFPAAMNNLANIYDDGLAGEKQRQKALDLYRRAAQMGQPTAMLNLAEIYVSSEEGKANPFLSLAYYMLAEKYGMADAAPQLKQLQTITDPAVISKAQAYAKAWKPGGAMPEES